MVKKLFALFSFLLLVGVVQAAPVSRGDAQKKALQFLADRNGGVAATRGLQSLDFSLHDGAAVEQLHIFNIGQQEGFVIVSGDDRAPEILGYADSGEISAENMPDNLRAWLQGYADQIKWMQEHGITNNVAAARPMRNSAKATISTLLTTQWDQGTPYNNNCPSFSAGGSHAVTGCVATATAQIMFYQAKKHSIATTTTSSIPSYYSKKYYWYLGDTQYSGLPEKSATTIDWSKIDASLTTEEARAEVARLFEYIGAAVQMQYGPVDEGGSSAANEAVVTALVNYFGYDPDVKSIYRADCTTDNEWVDAIYAELSTNGPVLMGGQSSGGGHAFVVDGYYYDSNDSKDYFHINWGWGGTSDGNFLLTALNPQTQGVGGSSTNDGYNYNQVAMVNVNPTPDGNDLSATACLTVNRWRVNYKTVGWNSQYTNYFNLIGYTLYPLQMNYSFVNATGWDLNFDWGVALYSGDSFVRLVYGPTSQTFANRMSSYGSTLGLQFSNQLADGEYRLVAVSKKKGTGTWYPCIGSEKYYVKVTVSNSGADMTLKNLPPVEGYGAYGSAETIEIADGNVTVPNDVYAVDLTWADELTSVTPNSNPNTLYFVTGSVPSGLDNKNVVQNGVAATLTLNDNYGFYTPFGFTATNASYTRQFSVGANGTGGWSTIVLPFNVTSVKQGETPIDWFHNSSDTGKNFWLKEFVNEDGGSVNFGFVDSWVANKPYIIAVPGNTWGDEFDLTNKNITFCGSNVEITPGNNLSTSVTNYKFQGTMANWDVNNCYILNNDGTSFVLDDNGTLQPFRACFTQNNTMSGLPDHLTIGSADGSATGIVSIKKQNADNQYYNLQGQRVSQPGRGLYIINGKKIIVK